MCDDPGGLGIVTKIVRHHSPDVAGQFLLPLQGIYPRTAKHEQDLNLILGLTLEGALKQERAAEVWQAKRRSKRRDGD